MRIDAGFAIQEAGRMGTLPVRSQRFRLFAGANAVWTGKAPILPANEAITVS